MAENETANVVKDNSYSPNIYLYFCRNRNVVKANMTAARLPASSRKKSSRANRPHIM